MDKTQKEGNEKVVKGGKRGNESVVSENMYVRTKIKEFSVRVDRIHTYIQTLKSMVRE